MEQVAEAIKRLEVLISDDRAGCLAGDVRARPAAQVTDAEMCE